MKVLSKEELRNMMPHCYKAKHNTWLKSNIFKDLYFWSADKSEHSTFPAIYAKLNDLKTISMELYGTEGYLTTQKENK